ncbi:unnamed protein product [Linum trigynum]|uniref:Uncharacterized protein n=1 Tax=Linum trigynum TaxID=586398 RepID=A0AAV2E7W1_9ROSI
MGFKLGVITWPDLKGDGAVSPKRRRKRRRAGAAFFRPVASLKGRRPFGPCVLGRREDGLEARVKQRKREEEQVAYREEEEATGLGLGPREKREGRVACGPEGGRREFVSSWMATDEGS